MQPASFTFLRRPTTHFIDTFVSSSHNDIHSLRHNYKNGHQQMSTNFTKRTNSNLLDM